MAAYFPKISLSLPPDHPFITISVAVYDNLQGIKILYTWSCSQTDLDLTSYFKAAMGNIHRQSPESLKCFPCSFIEFMDSSSLMSSCIFQSEASGRKSIYSLSYFFQSDKVTSNPSANELISMYQTAAACAIKPLIEERALIYDITPAINQSATQLANIFGSKLEISDTFASFSPELSLFYATALTSHIQTQMTTIIETESAEAAAPIISFLSRFTLPFQRSLSSEKIYRHPIPGLFLHCVEPHRIFPTETLIQFKRPWTWIRLSDLKVFQSPDTSTQAEAFRLSREILVCPPTMLRKGVAMRMEKLIKSYQAIEAKPSIWSIDFFEKLNRTEKSLQCTLSDGCLEDLVLRALTEIEMANSILGDSQLLTKDQMSDIANSLSVRDREEMKMLISIAQMFDNRAHRRFFSCRKEVIMHMIATL